MLGTPESLPLRDPNELEKSLVYDELTQQWEFGEPVMLISPAA